MNRKDFTIMLRQNALKYIAEELGYWASNIVGAVEAIGSDSQDRNAFDSYVESKKAHMDFMDAYDSVKPATEPEEIISRMLPLTFHGDGEAMDFILDTLANATLDPDVDFNMNALRGN